MLRFFRQLRKKTLVIGSGSRYLGYALGEIFLVVVGILIALQANNWNEKRIARAEERQLMENLAVEFSRTKRTMESIIPALQRAEASCVLLVNLCGEEHLPVSNLQIDSLLINSTFVPPLKSPQPVYQELMNSDRLEKLSNQALKDLLYSWQNSMNLLALDYNAASIWGENYLRDILIDQVAYKNWDVVGNSFEWERPSRLADDYSPLFRSLRFENIMVNKRFWTERIEDRYHQLIAQCDEIMAELE